MSIFSECTLTARNSEETLFAGSSLAHTLYRENLLILLTGDLGVGKTTFAQGFASGLGIKDRVVSPTYALEQRYEKFIHIDLYRLTSRQAEDFLVQSEDSQGIRLIEWAERIDRSAIGPHIHVHIDDRNGVRTIRCDFFDEPVPDDTEIDRWLREIRLPKHIIRHCEKVTEVADALAAFMMQTRHTLIRKQALHAAARTHDLLRFVDFKTWNGDADITPTESDRVVWNRLKQQYGTPHEAAAKKFLCEYGYHALGDIVRMHRGMDENEQEIAKTIEQKLLAYADKRVAFDGVVTLDERFSDLGVRYGNGRINDHQKKWLTIMKAMEKELFPKDPPTL